MRQQDLTSGTTAWEPRAAGNIPYKEDITYDGNGNILTYKRNGSRTDVDDLMDELAYTYDNTGGIPTNRLQSVQDASNNASYTTDFKGTNEYTYDKIGNLIAETPNGASAISWTVYGKINSIALTGGGSLSYRYDAGGNRVYKLYNKPGGGAEETWYVRDAPGNTLATYTQENGVMKWAEQHLYGSSRLGLWEPELNVSSGSTEVESKWLAAGNKRYELTNHLGNVLAVLSDNKLGTTEYTAEVISMQDYYPFGMLMVGRSFNVGGYRYGFNGQEKSDEIKGEGNSYTAAFWEYDPRIGRRWNLDPKPTVGISMYSAFNGNPIAYSDVLGDAASLGTRIMGGVKGVGGLIEMGVGATTGTAYSWTGVGGLLGGAAFVHGADVSSHGFTEMITGEPAPTYTQQLVSRGLRLGGMPVDKANLVAEFMDAAASIALTAGAATTPRDGTFVVKPLLSAPSSGLPPPQMAGFSLGGSKIPLALKPAAASEISNGCEAVAKTVHKAIGGDFLQITPNFGNMLGPVKYAGGEVSGWFHHVAVIKEGIVYDKMTGAAGMAVDKYKQLFEYASDLTFEVSKTLTLK